MLPCSNATLKSNP